MSDRMVFLKNWEVQPVYQNKLREQGGYVVSPECRSRCGCSLCDDCTSISPIKLTKAEYEFARVKNKAILDRSVARQKYIICPYEECPYTELYKHETYRDYEKETHLHIKCFDELFNLIEGSNRDGKLFFGTKQHKCE